MRKIGLQPKNAQATANDASLSEERKSFTKEGKEVPGFTSSVVPTLEEKTVAERRPPPERTAPDSSTRSTHVDGKQNGHSKLPEEAHVDGELYGAPASSEGDQPSGGLQSKNDVDEESEKALSARATLRKNLVSRVASKSAKGLYTLPTPTPFVDPHGFEDPVCDEFWKDVWVACAVHNVSNA